MGVEHASKEDLWQSLKNCVTFSSPIQSLSFEEFLDLGLMGDSFRRNQVCQWFHIGPCNAKTCFKRLNGMNVTKKEIEDRFNAANCDN